MKALITGIAGFAGSHLAELLLNDGDEVFGTILPGEKTRNIDPFLAHLSLTTCDIRDADAVRSLVAESKPDAIFHLAAIAFIPDSIVDPRLTFETNLFGTLNVFEAAKRLASPSRVVFVGSADAYGLVRPDELPVTELNALRPTNPYSVSKASADLLAYQYALAGQVHAVRVRPFNHTGPRQSPQFVCSDFARQVVNVERGRNPSEIRVGNLKPKRDFTDVRDVVRAYRDILDHGEPGEAYNVCSGVSVSVGEIVDMLLSLSGCRAEIAQGPDRVRASDVAEMRGDYGKLERATGWKPSIPLDKTLGDMLEYWRDIE